MATSTQSILQELTLSSRDKALLGKWMRGVQADLAALQASQKATTAKLDADATVTDTDYASNDPAISTGV